VIEVNGLAVLKLGGVTVTVFPDPKRGDRMAIILEPGEEVGFDILAPNGARFGQISLESDDRMINGMLTARVESHADFQYMSTDTPWPENQVTQVVVRGVEPRPRLPEPTIREVLDVR